LFGAKTELAVTVLLRPSFGLSNSASRTLGETLERAQEESTTYAMWILEKQFMLVPSHRLRGESGRGQF
jgi:hypothetical protein